jgi:Plasmid pRiA4b ORF-3-like protein
MPRRASNVERNYILQIDLQEVVAPRISRTLSVPPSISFHKLHHAILLAFGWQDIREYSVQVLNTYKISNELEVRKTKALTLEVLLRLDSPGLAGERFDIGGDLRTRKTAKSTKLRDVFENEQHMNRYVGYEDSFGRREHSVIHVGSCPPSGAIVCLSGSEGGPAAVARGGGPTGWMRLKEAVQQVWDGDVEGIPNYKIVSLQKYGDLDPWNWDKDQVNGELADIDTTMRHKDWPGYDSDPD